ncbi:MAG TPA: exodeoxyribonuclease VII large subunit [Tepidisphaeraceae bacterium]|nr:exodeoxyribonuclease VII large subunit [Tepidisphaeraceae bacterium]
MSGSFWDFKEKFVRKSAPGTPARDDSAPGSRNPKGPEPLSVSQLTGQIERALKDCLPASVLVRGEVSNFKHHAASGHMYFTLKDADACIDCVMFRSEAARLKFKPGDGLDLVATGRVGVYGQRGKYQLYITTLNPLGQGALELARQQIESKLRAEGLFEADRKRELPRFPTRIAVVTSTGTAALQDILKVVRRFPFLSVCVYHVPVQGEGAAAKIAAALTHLGKAHEQIGGVDVVLLARGGGSLEDLWQFNEEVVARAVAACPIPVISGIGHEIDVSIADLAVDYHAHTPTEAAQVATREWRTAGELVDSVAHRVRRQVRLSVADARRRLDGLARHEVFRRPADVVDRLRQQLDDREQALALAVGARLRAGRAKLAKVESRLVERHPRHLVRLHGQRLGLAAKSLGRAIAHWREHMRDKLDALAGRVECVNPEVVLKRGYSVTLLKKGGQVIRDPADVKPGDRIVTRLSGGEIESRVEDVKQMELFGE